MKKKKINLNFIFFLKDLFDVMNNPVGYKEEDEEESEAVAVVIVANTDHNLFFLNCSKSCNK